MAGENLPARKESEKGERSLFSKIFQKWGGVYTRAARTSMPQDRWYNLENLQPIGDANIHTIPNISAVKLDYGADSIYWADYANIGGTDYIISFATNGKVFAYNIGAGTSAQISSALSGANSRMDQWKNLVIVIIDANGLYSWDGTTFTKITVAGVPSSGQAIAVYAGRVWVAQNRTLFYSVVDGYGSVSTDWTAANGAGFVNLTDPQIRSSVTQMKAGNGYLYIFGRSSINVIADVYVPSGASPPTPVFTNLNVQAIIGTDQPASAFLYNRSMMLANRYGAFALNGVTAQKISDDIDGTWQYLDFTQVISGGQFVVNNILTAAFLVKRLNDPVFGSNTVLACWWDNKWWFANYGSLTFALSAYANNVPSLFGFIGNKLYQLFSDTTTQPNFAFSGPLWSMDDQLRDKEVIKAGLELQIASFQGQIIVNVDTPNSSVPYSATASSLVQWQNNSGQVVLWKNNANATVNWLNSGYALFSGAAPGSFAKYVGMSGSGYGTNLQLSALMMDYAFGKRW